MANQPKIQTLANTAVAPQHPVHLRPTPYQQKQDAIHLLRTTLSYLTLPLDTLLPAESTLKAIAYKSKKLGLTSRSEYRALSERIIDLDCYREIQKGGQNV